jgi:hypothetical protein
MAEQIKWENSLTSSLKLAKKNQKSVLVNFYAPT